MSTKDTIRSQEKAGNLPGWQIYSEMSEKDDFVYLEFEGGVQVDVNMIGSLWGHPPGTVVLRLPTATARQLGIVPQEWTGDAFARASEE
ncbi:hypothetical protein ACFQ3P_41895 [Paraburkholderia sabiae]|uniref:DUF2971 domain-containing protein n=1 Tax=Paraburkholderia sabiae TaxID=273251 RepID=A0ABU9QSW3_9BURK|nr:hypothetical protein [Paraburkholderia sabiae]WJZ72173.1 hypothetical protein QEN71_18515 [Paraburkholderia sabiae]CAD6563127.1 hypothetical protein LMG24235_08369 [Paraburkholderia sabiae]